MHDRVDDGRACDGTIHGHGYHFDRLCGSFAWIYTNDLYDLYESYMFAFFPISDPRDPLRSHVFVHMGDPYLIDVQLISRSLTYMHTFLTNIEHRRSHADHDRFVDPAGRLHGKMVTICTIFVVRTAYMFVHKVT